MELTYTDTNYKDLGVLNFQKSDFDIGGDNNFEISIPLTSWVSGIDFGSLIYEEGYETGGVVSAIETATDEQLVKLKGYTWRGYLANHIIEPPSGQDYLTVSGDVNACISSVINNKYSGLIMGSSQPAGVNISNYQFKRYVTVLDGLTEMLKTVEYKLKITHTIDGTVEVSAVPVVDYSENIELSQDSRINFKIENNKGSVNHLICLGAGELKNRTVLHLYLDSKGNIGTTQYFFGINEIMQTYDNANSENLRADGEKEFKNLLNGYSFSMDIQALGIDVDIGDIIGGRDYITGITVKKPLKSKIITFENGVKSVQYNLEE